ncbi:uncharacterized protein LOC141854610 [Brevipalpus obovatus]|uniref:uncharacterized protein LOC141854610 n=1 Tax=Brevipalpus obovatus TaxID=246614 RepID=UPI003D9DD49A
MSCAKMLASTPNILQMCNFDGSKSTKGASKLRRDQINTEIAYLRDLLPLPSSTRQRLSQLQLMALVCVYVRKAIYFQNAFHKHELTPEAPIPHFGFSKALNGFLMMMTQNGKLLYISDNAAEYLGHSMEDLLIHGDSVYDIIEKQDHQTIQSELMRTPNSLNIIPDNRLFLCRMNVSRNARRQMRFGDQKVVLVEGHFVSYLPLCSRNEPVFLATCTPIAMPETRECVVQGSTNVFTSIHSMDMRFMHLDRNGEFHLGYSKSTIQGMSWYDLVHYDNVREAQSKHRLITQSEQERSCILLLRLETNNHEWVWIHSVLQVKDSSDNSQQPVIVCTNQVLSEKEALVMQTNNWLYQFYSLHSKMHYGLAYEANSNRLPTYYTSGSSAAVATAMISASTGGYTSTGSTTSPESGSVPLHPAAVSYHHHHHIHPAINPLNGVSPGHHHPSLSSPHHHHHHHPYHPNSVIPYSTQPGSLPYPSFVPSVTSSAAMAAAVAVAANTNNIINNTTNNNNNNNATPTVTNIVSPSSISDIENNNNNPRSGVPLKRAHHHSPPPPQATQSVHNSGNNGDSNSTTNSTNTSAVSGRSNAAANNGTFNTSNQQQQQQQDPDDDSESPEPIAKRVNHGHHLPPPPSTTTYHHPRAAPFTYPASMFGAGGYTAMASDLGTVVPVSGYYGGHHHHQVLASVPTYHPAQIGHHFRTQNKLSLFDHDTMDTSDLETTSLTPSTLSSPEEMANMISIGSSSNLFKYSHHHSALTALPNHHHHHHQYYAPLDVERYSRKSPQSTTSDYGSGTSSPPSSTSSSSSSYDKPQRREETNLLHNLECSPSSSLNTDSLSSSSTSAASQVYHPLRNWNNYPIYADLSSSRPLSKVFPNEVYPGATNNASSVFDSSMSSSVTSSNPGSNSLALDPRLLYHHHHQTMASEYTGEHSIAGQNASGLVNNVSRSTGHQSLMASSEKTTTATGQSSRRTRDSEKSR